MSSGDTKTTTQTTSNSPWSGVQPTFNRANQIALSILPGGTSGTNDAASTTKARSYSGGGMAGNDLGGSLYNTADYGGSSYRTPDYASGGGLAGGGLLSGGASSSNSGGINLSDPNIEKYWKPFEGNTYVDQSPETLQSYGMMTDAANRGVIGLDDATAQAQGLIRTNGGTNGIIADYASGKYMDGNPYLQDQLQRGADDIQGRIGDMAAASGRSLSASHQNLLSEDLGNYFTDAYSQNYQNSVNNMMNANQLQQAGGALGLQAGQALPTLYQAGLLPAETLAQVGAGKEEQDSLVLQDEIDKYYAYRDMPKEMSWYANGIAGGAGQFSNSTATVQRPSTPWYQQAAGLGLTAAGLFA